jgi:fructose-specific phosphotransferase system IIA component
MRLTDVLKQEFIKIPLESKDRDSSIGQLIDLLNEREVITSKQPVYNAVLEREKLMTTGVGNGIAIPHCKHKDSPEFAVCLGVHKNGIDFQAIDSKPVRIIFLLVGPEHNPGLHIKLLSRISRLMSNEELRNQLQNCESSDAAFELIQEEENYFFELD